VQADRDVLAAWPGFEHARLMRARFIEVSLLEIRGRAALAAALDGTGETRRAALADVTRCANRLTATGARWAVGLAAALHAGGALASSDQARARTQLEHAASTFAAADMALHAANARMIRATLTGDTEVATRERRTISDAGGVDDERYSRMMLPPS
jgi:hypothetical protein